MRQVIKVKFAKKDLMRFISHLDLMRLFYRALRRAELPITISKGFNPRPRISVEPALKLGEESSSLELTVKLDAWIKPALFKEKLQAELPDGIELKTPCLRMGNARCNGGYHTRKRVKEL